MLTSCAWQRHSAPKCVRRLHLLAVAPVLAPSLDKTCTQSLIHLLAESSRLRIGIEPVQQSKRIRDPIVEIHVLAGSVSASKQQFQGSKLHQHPSAIPVRVRQCERARSASRVCRSQRDLMSTLQSLSGASREWTSCLWQRRSARRTPQSLSNRPSQARPFLPRAGRS